MNSIYTVTYQDQRALVVISGGSHPTFRLAGISISVIIINITLTEPWIDRIEFLRLGILEDTLSIGDVELFRRVQGLANLLGD